MHDFRCMVSSDAFYFQSSGEVSPASLTPSSTPSLAGTHAPKYGTVIPNRIFVGGIAANVRQLPRFVDYNLSHNDILFDRLIGTTQKVPVNMGAATIDTNTRSCPPAH